jgi:3D (Asp-Asp-Asp) domain-containing protein
MAKLHIPLPEGSRLEVPFFGTFLTKAAMDSIEKHRLDLFTEASSWRLYRVIPDKLWLARKKRS